MQDWLRDHDSTAELSKELAAAREQDCVERSMPAEELPRFRADQDHVGEWHVWRRLTSNGWVTVSRCESRDEAIARAETLNEQMPAVQVRPGLFNQVG